MFRRCRQDGNTSKSICVTPLPIVTFSRLAQEANARGPICVTPSGIVTSVTPVPLNALSPRPVTGYPPNSDGTVSRPVGFGETAALTFSPVPISTLPSVTLYVYV